MIGQQVFKYRILEKIATGNNGTVYRAEHSTLGTPVALKFIHPERMAEPENRARFAHEARAAAKLNHAAICKVFDFEEFERTAFIAMDYLEGETLRTRLERGPLSVKHALLMGMQIAEGLAEAHSHGIVHRDIKPGNLMITMRDNGRFQVKILDFGVARTLDSSSVTQMRSLIGTAMYMAPEQMESLTVDARTDVWSLGVVLYEMIAGRPPFRGEHIQAIQYEVMQASPPPLEKLRPDVPPALNGVVRKALRRRPADRYQTAEAFHDELRRQFRGQLRPRHPFLRWLKKRGRLVAHGA